MKISKFQSINFVWKYLAGFFLLLAVFLFFDEEIYWETFNKETICDYLPEGEYMLTVEYAGAPEGSSYALIANSLVTPENKQGTALIAENLPAGDGRLQVMIEVPAEARRIFVSSDYVAKWEIQSVKPSDYDNYFLMLLFISLAVLSLLYGAFFYRKEHHAVLALVGVGILSSLPLFGQTFPHNGDIIFHFARINGIYEGLRSGQFPVRINPTQLAGHGYITGVMYPQLFLYVPAVLKFFHVSTMLGVQLLIFAANLATPLFTYAAVRNICKNDRMGFLAAVFYTLNPYRLINFYSRGALGEGLATVFLPLVLWGTYEILWNRREKWWILALGMTGVLSSHLLSVELCAVLILGEMLPWFFSGKRNDSFKRILAMGKAALYTILLNLYFLGPFLSFSKLKLVCFSLSNNVDPYTLNPVRAFEPFAQWGDLYYPLSEPAFMSVTLGGVALFGICLFAALLLKSEEYGKDEVVEQGKRYLVMGGLFFIITLWIVPWEKLMQIKWVEHTIGVIQFPWRTFGMTALLLGIVTAIAVVLWESVGQRTMYRYLCPALFVILLLECGGYFGNVAHSAKVVDKKTAEASNNSIDNLYLYAEAEPNTLPLYYYIDDFTHISSDMVEHLSWFNAYNTGPGVVCGEPDGIKWTNYKKNRLHISADVSSKQDFYAAFPLYYYPGYHVLVDGKETEAYPWYTYLTCDLTKGTHHIEIEWVKPTFFAVCDIFSLCVTALTLLWWIFKRRTPFADDGKS